MERKVEFQTPLEPLFVAWLSCLSLEKWKGLMRSWWVSELIISQSSLTHSVEEQYTFWSWMWGDCLRFVKEWIEETLHMWIFIWDQSSHYRLGKKGWTIAWGNWTSKDDGSKQHTAFATTWKMARLCDGSADVCWFSHYSSTRLQSARFVTCSQIRHKCVKNLWWWIWNSVQISRALTNSLHHLLLKWFVTI